MRQRRLCGTAEFDIETIAVLEDEDKCNTEVAAKNALE
jgi:hypothetical protein